jgi:hypothetical protein
MIDYIAVIMSILALIASIIDAVIYTKMWSEQMTIAEILIQHLENKEYDKFYDLYESIREQAMWYNDSRGAIIEVLLPKEVESK